MKGTSIFHVEGADVCAAVWDTPLFDVAHISVCGPDKDVNEDALLGHVLSDESIVACVIDGMGGMHNGRAAARLTAEQILNQLEGHEPGSSRRAALIEGFEQAHAVVSAECGGGGATAAGAVITPTFIQPVHTGDAEVLLVGQRGKLKYRSVSQSPVGYAVHAGYLSEAEALTHPDRHLVSSGIGVQGMTLEVGPKIRFARRDTVVLASDGLTDNVFEAEIVRALRKGTLVEQLDGLIALTRGRMAAADEEQGEQTIGKPDDLTVMVIRRR